ncbi:hypothetical protein ACETRX_04030 [Labrys portucalensis]|uniref:HTH luxR-type domain-containing protein n=1 Tax=Labrys neptuniae TaxID=376174 RepID=A0ABV6Z9B9_9HYPH
MNDEQIKEAGMLWLTGKSTSEIASALFMFESDVERHIEKIKAEAHLIAARAA